MNTNTPLPTIATNLKHFIGTTQYYKAFELPNLYWTDGVQYYLKELNAYPIIEWISYYSNYIAQGNLHFLQDKSPELDSKQLQMLSGIQFWSITQDSKDKWMLGCTADTDFPILFKHFFDFPLIPQKFFCQRYTNKKWVLMLNTEY